MKYEGLKKMPATEVLYYILREREQADFEKRYHDIKMSKAKTK